MENNISIFKVDDKLLNQYGRIYTVESIKFYSKKQIKYFFTESQYGSDENDFDEKHLSEAEKHIKDAFEKAHQTFIESFEILNYMKEKLLQKEQKNAN